MLSNWGCKIITAQAAPCLLQHPLLPFFSRGADKFIFNGVSIFSFISDGEKIDATNPPTLTAKSHVTVYKKNFVPISSKIEKIPQWFCSFYSN